MSGMMLVLLLSSSMLVGLPVYMVVKTMRADYLGKKIWKSLPTVDEYLAAYNSHQSRGICCWKCKSNQISDWDVYETGSVHFCRRCKTRLYRTG